MGRGERIWELRCLEIRSPGFSPCCAILGRLLPSLCDPPPLERGGGGAWLQPHREKKGGQRPGEGEPSPHGYLVPSSPAQASSQPSPELGGSCLASQSSRGSGALDMGGAWKMREEGAVQVIGGLHGFWGRGSSRGDFMSLAS